MSCKSKLWHCFLSFTCATTFATILSWSSVGKADSGIIQIGGMHKNPFLTALNVFIQGAYFEQKIGTPFFLPHCPSIIEYSPDKYASLFSHLKDHNIQQADLSDTYCGLLGFDFTPDYSAGPSVPPKGLDEIKLFYSNEADISPQEFVALLNERLADRQSIINEAEGNLRRYVDTQAISDFYKRDLDASAIPLENILTFKLVTLDSPPHHDKVLGNSMRIRIELKSSL